MSAERDVIVVGAGPAGLAVAASVKKRGLDARILEAADSVATSWRSHYDRLHLHTTRGLSGLPGWPIPRAAGRWVSRDDFIAYLEDYTRHNQLAVSFGTRVERVDRTDGVWRLTTSKGTNESRHVVIATGYNHSPQLPEWLGRNTFRGELIHSSAYRNPHAYRGRTVLVVGAGNSGAEIAADLVEGGAAKVWCSIRTAPNIVRRNFGPVANQYIGIAVHGLPVGAIDRISLLLQRLTIGDLTAYGVESPSKGVYTRVLEEHIPLIDVGFLSHLKRGEIEVVPAMQKFADGEVWCGNRPVQPDAVIAATGFSRGLEPLVGHLGVLTPTGRPSIHAPNAAPATPGLYFIGYTNPIVGNLYEVSKVAQKLAANLSNLG